MQASVKSRGDIRDKLESGLAELSMDVPEKLIDALLVYLELLEEWSGSFNLIAPRDRKHLLERHLLDSLSLAPWLQPGSLLDVGTGAGLPGLPLAIIKPQMQATLLDSAGKKIRFIRHVGRVLKLSNIHPVQQRIESLGGPGAYSNITSRAFASLQDFVAAVRQQADKDTRMLAMKGACPHRELEELPGWVKLLSVEKLMVPGLHAERHLVIMSLL